MKIKFLTLAAFAIFAFVGCKKDECHECHYDAADGSEVELGEYCGDELEDLEEGGYTDSTGNYEVHCHGH
ncbi:MAG: hypothetical protein FJY17_10185 [Bacteroidetes bacterium]|nr:hypothetical protein [Bacteroidota bacterium]MBM3419271.1 hypothetical protein [Bacteroidota bacterium]